MNDIQIHIGTEELKGKSKRHFAFEVKHLNQVRKYLSNNQVIIKDEQSIHGYDRISIFDYWDNRIELMEKVD